MAKRDNPPLLENEWEVPSWLYSREKSPIDLFKLSYDGVQPSLTFVKTLPTDNMAIICNFTFFPSVLEKLTTEGHDTTGIVRVNRMEKAPLMHKEGSFKQITNIESNVTLLRYNGSDVVTLASTASGVEPVDKVCRWTAAEKKHTSVNQLSCDVHYHDSTTYSSKHPSRN
ncbi:hypothetical protein J6590_048857 [Homalodisca vitripennis]|nr:hypothetical protein J6590_048857 [Homalodisca vitripennis]